MAQRIAGKWRFELVFGLLLLAMVAMGARIFQLNWTLAAQVDHMVQRQQRMTIPDPGRPGNVFIRAGKGYILLCGSRPVPSIFADPTFIDEDKIGQAAADVGRALHVDPVRVYEKIELGREHGRRFIWLKRRATQAQADAVKAFRYPAIGIAHEWRREYPSGSLGASIAGFAPSDTTAPTGAGVELTQRRYLAAHDGHEVVLTDAARRPIWPLPDETVEPRDGQNLLLCINASIQDYLEEAVSAAQKKFEGKWAVGVVADPKTGEILALCSEPSYNPNDYVHANPADRTDRAISLPYEPGSAAKVIFASAGVDAGVVTWDTMLYCEDGQFFPPRGGRITDHGNHYGLLSVTDVVVHSSNIGMAKIGLKLGNRQLYDIAHRFGLGEPTGVALPGESRGIVRDLRKWDGYSTPRVPFGQEISTTAIQLAMAYCALSNGGELLRPRIVERVVNANWQTVWQSQRQVVRRVLKKSTAAGALAAMTQVVERGTGTNCQLSRWTSYGKTGTAQIPGGRAGYRPGAYTSTFIGGAPASDPRVVCIVSVFWPKMSLGYYGGKVSAPAVKDVLEKTLAFLDVPPDKEESTSTEANKHTAD